MFQSVAAEHMVGKRQMLISFFISSLNEQYQYLNTDWEICGVFWRWGGNVEFMQEYGV